MPPHSSRTVDKGNDRKGNDRPLSDRQAEVLTLLKAGKANKDIARELGIGLGTVKQHLVALFKKLHVTNRVQAVSRDFEPRVTPPPPPALPDPADGSMELRPATVLSLSALSGGILQDVETWQRLQKACSAAICDLDAGLISRPGVGVDIIFGLHHVYEDNAVRAARVASDVARRLRKESASEMIHAGIASGYLMASMQRRGGWTGETVAGRIVTLARDLKDMAAPGQARMDHASSLLMAFALRARNRIPVSPSQLPLTLSLLGNDPEPWATTPPPAPLLVGRADERRTLDDFIGRLEQGRGALVWVEGESGMGKTTLCHAFGAMCVHQKLRWLEGRCGDDGDLSGLLRRLGGSPSGEQPLIESLFDTVAAIVAQEPLVLMIDDLHLANGPTTDLVQRLATLTPTAPLLLLGVGRKIRQPALCALIANAALKLRHLPPGDIETLIDNSTPSPLSRPSVAAITRLARGVPLFATELARQAIVIGWSAESGSSIPPLPLTLVTLILSRVDEMPLDRSLLSAVARKGPCAVARLRAEWRGDLSEFDKELDLAVRAGLLSMPPGNEPIQVGFSHPLVTEVLHYVLLSEQLQAMKQASRLP
ncbi:MAG: AAA family ATPase [Alphaproteobacteria bacterium]|nr:AAA family ATPase [Alphaproteobacteria bacterium]